ncbi:hypothetical protein HYH02_013157 [Chlamydomonas schloesseri]|uniref:Uncharacterized protein n=1 Tax=Chlamydomonas schloesseri TaxID=2026947 RepID=A0A835W003_9CHLO|nr:hypothetical protein HYH02_013157 [Chlamydomonas schloesseri]|eukprot:KAG2431939.1 hypothetical protein HYH02_013157 [Chlamydomonas schloesseri]
MPAAMDGGSRSGSARSPGLAVVPPPPGDSPGHSPGGGAGGWGGRLTPRSGRDSPIAASPSAQPRDIVDSYLRQLYGGDTATRVLAAQGLGALPSFLPRSQSGLALAAAMDLGVVGSLADVLACDEELSVQEACLLALASLLLATAPHEDHAAPLKPPHLKLLGPTIIRPEVLEQMGYILTVTTSSRVVLAAARVVAITAPHISQSNDVHVLESRIIPALQAAIANAPGPGERPTSGAGGAAVATPRDAAACALALLALASETPDLYVAVRSSGFYQSLAVLYQRTIDPGQTSAAVLPADAAALLLRAVTLPPSSRWAASLGRGAVRAMERQLEESDALECLCSYVAVEAGALRALGQGLAETAADNARAVIEKNSYELEHLHDRQRNLGQRLAEAKDAAADARRALEDANAALDVALERAADADAAVQASRHPLGGTPEQRRARREAEGAAARAEEAVTEAAEAAAEAEEAVEDLRHELGTVRRAVGPVRWQSDRMARLEAAAAAWLDTHGARGGSRPKVKLARPNLALLSQVLVYLATVVKSPASSASGPGSPGASSGGGGGGGHPAGALSSSPQHAAAMQAKALGGGLVQAVVRLSGVLAGLRALGSELAALAADLGLQPDMAGALAAAGGAMGREAAALAGVNRRAAVRLKQVSAESAKLRKALRLAASGRSGPVGGPGYSRSSAARAADLEAQLTELESEQLELGAVLADSEGLVELLGARLQAVAAASGALSEAQAAFVRAFPTSAAGSTPTKAAAAVTVGPRSPGGGGGHGSPNGGGGGANDAARALASHNIMAKDPSHPAGHLLGLLARSLAPVIGGSGSGAPGLPPGGSSGSGSNLAALVVHLYGSGASADWVAAVSGGPPGAGAGGGGGPPGVLGLLGFGMPGVSPGGGLLSAQASSISLGGSSVYGGGGGGTTGRSRPGSAGPSRPQSARSPGGGGGGGGGGTAGFGAGYYGGAASSARPASARTANGSATASPRSPRGPGGYGAGVGSSGYGGGYGGFSGFTAGGGAGGGGGGSGLSYPVDAVGRPMRYPLDSNYGIIQATHSPLRGYSSPNNGPSFALLLRDKVWSRGGPAASATAGGSSSSSSSPTSYSRSSPTTANGMSSSTSAATAAGLGAGAAAAGSSSRAVSDAEAEAALAAALAALPPVSGELPVAAESGRVVAAVANSVLFDPVDLAVLGPGVLQPAAANGGGVGGGGSQASTAHGGAKGGSTALLAPATAEPHAGTSTGTMTVCVLDALLLQSELLCGVLWGLAALAAFCRTAGRACRSLPTQLDFAALAALPPGQVPPSSMAALHRMWAEALGRQPELRVPIARSVQQVAELGLVPPADFAATYQHSGLVAALVAMLAGALRPGGGDSSGKAKSSDAADAGAGSPPASPGGGGGGGGPGSPGSPHDAGTGTNADSRPAPLAPRHIGRMTATAPPTLRLSPAQQAEQAAAARALLAISDAQPEVLASIAQDEQLLSRLSRLCLDHSMSWPARLAAADLLADLVLGGGPGAAAAVAGGAYAGLAEVMNRETYPYLNQDPRGSKATVVSALAAVAAHEELLEGVVTAAAAPSGPSSGLPLDSPDQVLSAILRSLWAVCQQVYSTMAADRTGRGRHVDPALISALTATAATAAHELAVLADTQPQARRVLQGELGLGRKISIPFLQAIKDPPLYEALLELRKNIS